MNGLPPEERLLAEAGRWMALARSGEDMDRAAFRTWLEASPDHVAAMDAVERAWRLAPAAVRAAGLSPRRSPAPASRSGGWKGWGRAGGLALAGLAGMAVWFGSVDRHLYQTGAQERRAVTLADGSKAWIAPSSRLTVTTTPLGRTASLDGQAIFDVRHQWRPFVVDAGGVRTVDRGTVFAVSNRAGAVSVLLAEGRIEVKDRASGVVLASPRPGERVDVERHAARIVDADPKAELAWRDGRVVANDEPLSAVLARFAEQGVGPVHLADARLARLRVSGVYAVDDIEPFLKALSALHPVTWRRDGRGYEVRPRS